MLRSFSRRHAATGALREMRRFSTSATLCSNIPNARLKLDPSFDDFMKNAADMNSWKGGAPHASISRRAPRELEIYHDDPPATDDYLTSEELDAMEVIEDRPSRKSPAARFGSQRHGMIVMPSELQRTITKLISGSDKPLLHLDAKRLFLDERSGESHWETSYDVRYKNRRQASQHAERDGTAFASVALPSHYAAIVAVLDHVKQRLGPSWTAQHVIDWGTGTGSGLWAAAHVFQRSPLLDSAGVSSDPEIANSTVSTYLGLDKRDGLVSIGRRLLNDVNVGALKVAWKQAFKESDKVPYIEGNGVLALSAFMLSSLQTPLARKTLVTEMWESGADTIIIIDHSTSAGFECIAEARASILGMSQKQSEDTEVDGVSTTQCHVVAPCPHDRACPLYHPGSKRLVCGFSQRLQRPEFVRKTKHSGQGHEDTGYSYVVIRRGQRPAATSHQIGRIGDIGRRELEKIAQKDKPVVELTVEGEHHSTPSASSYTADAASLNASRQSGAVGDELYTSHEVTEALRSEAYHWPRLVFPPLKKSGHIILDSCTAEGKIMRMTIPRSQGKQPFYDARKSSWGDIFPHEPKNHSQERFLPLGAKPAGDTPPAKSHDVGKRSKHDDRKHKSYSRLAEELNEHKKKLRQQRQFVAKNYRERI